MLNDYKSLIGNFFILDIFANFPFFSFLTAGASGGESLVQVPGRGQHPAAVLRPQVGGEGRNPGCDNRLNSDVRFLLCQ